MAKSSILLAFLLLAGNAFAAPQLSSPPSAGTSEALQLLQRKKFAEAFELLEPLAAARPSDRALARKAYIAGLQRMLELFKEKKNAEVVELSDRVISLDPDDYQGHFARGRALEELKRYPEAVESLRKARELSQHAFVTRALGNAHVLAGDFPAAVEQFEALVSSGAPQKKDLETLGVVAYKAGDVEKAILYLGKALELTPGDPGITRLLAKWTKEHNVQGNFSSASNAHFEVQFENTPAQRELKEKLLPLLERAYDEVTADFNWRPEETVKVVIYPSSGAYRDVSDAPSWSAAVYDGKIRIPTGETRTPDEALQRILQHEFTHLVVEKLGGNKVPTWMNEGIAQVEEKREVPWAKPLLRRVLGTKHLRGSFMSLEGLEGSFLGMAGDQARLAYAEAYYAVKHILDQGGMWGFTSMLQNLKEGSSPGEALQQATGYDYETFQKKWVESMMQDFHLAR